MSTFEESVKVMSDDQLVSLFNELNIKATITEQEVHRYEIYSKEIETRFDTRFKQALKQASSIYNLWDAAYVDKDHIWELCLETMGEESIQNVSDPVITNVKDDSEYCTSCASKLVWQSCMLICSGCKKHYAG